LPLESFLLLGGHPFAAPLLELLDLGFSDLCGHMGDGSFIIGEQRRGQPVQVGVASRECSRIA